MTASIIFGASGFIGRHLAKRLDSKTVLMDLDPSYPGSEFCDIREPINLKVPKSTQIFNLAAVHKTPGHKSFEYFETNISGAKNICSFASRNDINTIVFTSSIAPYGTWEERKYEDSIPMPTSPYGISKIVAEGIHREWQLKDPQKRRLVIVRPGIVFGKGEGGNFTRLYSMMKRGLFFYPGRKDTKKALIYVKDLVNLMLNMVKNESPGIHTYNAVNYPLHTIEEICEVIAKTTNIKKPKIKIPHNVMICGAHLINVFGKVINKPFSGVHPDRVRKLIISTNIDGQHLLKNGYDIQFPLEKAIEDWFSDCDFKTLE